MIHDAGMVRDVAGRLNYLLISISAANAPTTYFYFTADKHSGVGMIPYYPYQSRSIESYPHYTTSTPMTGILWGLLGAILIGSSDCIARVTAQRVSTSVLILFIMLISTALLSVWLIITNNLPPWNTWAWLASALSGVLNVVALYLLYLALARGPVAVASPAASSFAVILVTMNALAGEQWSVAQVFATVIVFFSVAMLSRQGPGAENSSQYSVAWLQKTALLGLAAAIAIALRMFLAQEAGDELGAAHSLYLNRLFAAVTCSVLVAVQLFLKHQLKLPNNKSTTLLVISQSLLEMAALGAFLAGSYYGDRVSASIGFSAFAAAAVIIARVFLGEVIGWWRGLWITAIGVGVVLAIIGNPQLPV